MSRISRALYPPLSLAFSVGGGVLAGAIFTQVWKRIGDDDRTAPDPKDLDRSTASVLTAAALQGLIFGVVRAVVQRAGSKGYQVLTDEPTPS